MLVDRFGTLELNRVFYRKYKYRKNNLVTLGFNGESSKKYKGLLRNTCNAFVSFSNRIFKPVNEECADGMV